VSSNHDGLPHAKVPTARDAIGRREHNHVTPFPARLAGRP
jgi:hypothetical protein